MGTPGAMVIIGVAAVVVSGVAVPVYLHRRRARIDRRDKLLPAYDEIFLALQRIRKVASTLSMGHRPTFPEEWDNDVKIVEQTGKGRYPVTNPSEGIQMQCLGLSSFCRMIKRDDDRSRFTIEDFDREFQRALNKGGSYGLYSILSGAISDSVQGMSIGRDIVPAVDQLVEVLQVRRDRDIEKG